MGEGGRGRGAALEAAREALDARFRARFAEAGAYLAARRWPEAWAAPRLPHLVRETIVWASRLDGGASFEVLARCYCEELVTGYVGQLLGGDDPSVALLWAPLDAARAPRLAGALAGMADALSAAGVAPTAHLGRGWPLVAGECAASLYAATVFGSGTPMLSASAPVRERAWGDVAGGADPAAVIDARMASGLAHELAHGLAVRADAERSAPPPPWMVTEAATILLHHRGAPGQVVPTFAGEAVPGTALYLIYGLVLARLFGFGRVFGLLRGELTLEEAVGPRVGRVLRVLGWQEMAGRLGAPPLYPDGLAAPVWARATALACASERAVAAIDDAAGVDALAPEEALAVAGVARAVSEVPWSATGWWHAAVEPLDEELFGVGLAALFIGHRMVDGVVEAAPARVPGDVVWIDAASCEAGVAQRASGDAFGPGHVLVPPPIARRLLEGGRPRVELTATGPGEAAAAAAALCAGLR